jgi:hypothetical protein
MVWRQTTREACGVLKYVPLQAFIGTAVTGVTDYDNCALMLKIKASIGR